MAYTLSFGLALGTSRTGLTLNAQLVDTAGADVGAAVATGFVEIGGGHYLWTYNGFPDNFRGGVEFFEQGTPGTILLFGAANPEEAEYVDVEISSRATPADVDASLVTYDAPTHAELVAETDSVQADIAALNNITAADVWAHGTRTLTSFGTLVADIWASATRTLTAFNFNVTVGDMLQAALAKFFTTDSGQTYATAAAGSVVGEIADNAIVTNEAAIAAEVDTVLSAAHGAGSWLTQGVISPTAVEFTYTVTEAVTGDPIDGVQVYFYTDSDLTDLAWVGLTDSFGVARDSFGGLPWLEPGTYTIRSQKSGYSIPVDTEIISNA